MIKAFFARNVYYPLYYILYRKDNTIKHYKFFKKAQWQTLEENRKIQTERLYELIKYASEKIPYYKHIIKANNIIFSNETILEDIKKFPILDKDIIRREFDNLHVIIDGVRWYNRTSSGSTGNLVKLIQDYDYHAESKALTMLMDDWAEYKKGTNLIKLWGSLNDILSETEGFKHRMANWAKSVYLLNSFFMDDERMNDYVNIINKKRPKMILSYAHSINELANFVKTNNLKVYSPKSIMTSAGVLYPEFRKTIEEVFRCPVFNRYGSREVGDVACECEKHEGLHVGILTHFIEILDEKHQPCEEGEIGEIYVTLLTNFTMPLIRYKIEDMAVYTNKKCSCGRGLPLINNIAGRISDFFITKKGRRVDSNAFHVISWTMDWVIRWKIIQKKPDLLVYKLKTKYKPPSVDLEEIEAFVKKVMGDECRVKFEFVDDIKPTISGKYRSTVREF